MATDEPVELLPCAICARTFKPQSLEKHSKICELTAVKKRKPFDSAKQRIQGTELAEFLPKETTKRKAYQPEDRGTNDKTSWKQTHDEFLQAIRAARGDTIETTRQRPLVPPGNVTHGVPTRPNEKGMCPTCNRQFSIKSYERHVAWCKDRAMKVPTSAATNIAKERLEARMRYRAPALKNRRPTIREKYSPSSALNLTSTACKSNNNANTSNHRAKETVSSPNCNDTNGGATEYATGSSKKSTLNTRRSGPSREGISSGPMKSRLSDRSNRPEIVTGRVSDCSSPRESSSRISNKHRNSHYSRVPGPRRDDDKSTNVCDEIVESEKQTPKFKSLDETGLAKNRRNRSLNIVHARSNGNPRINDTAINDEVTGMRVQPAYLRKRNLSEEDEFVTWKKIGESKKNEFLKFNTIEASKDNRESYLANVIENERKIGKEKTLELGNIPWASGIAKLDQTYLIRESLDGEVDFTDFCCPKIRRPIVESPRIQFHRYSVNSDDTESPTGPNLWKKRRDEIELGTMLSESSPLTDCPGLEPLNLTDVGNEEESQSPKSLESENHVTTSRQVFQRKSTKNSPKLRETVSDKAEIGNGALRDKNGETSINKRASQMFHSSFEKNQNIHTLDTSRSTKSGRTSEINFATVSRKKNKSLVGKDSIETEVVAHFGTCHEKTWAKDFSSQINLTNNDECSKVMTSRSLRSRKSYRESLERERVTEKNGSNAENKFISNEPWDFGSSIENHGLQSDKLCTEIQEVSRTDEEEMTSQTKREEKESFPPILSNVGPCDNKNSENLTQKLDESDEISDVSKSPENRKALETNCDDFVLKKMAEMRSMVINLDLKCYAVNENAKNLQSNVFPHNMTFQTEEENVIDISQSLEKKECKDDRERDVTARSKFNDRKKKIVDSEAKMDEGFEKSDESENSFIKSKTNGKMNYQRCGTYVIDTKTNSKIATTQCAPEELSDGKPLAKRKRLNDEAVEKDLEKCLNLEDSTERKSTPDEKKKKKDDRSPKESLNIDYEKGTKHFEASNQSKIQVNKSSRDFCEKFVNEKFNYDSDEAPSNENCLNYFESDSFTKIDAKLSSECKKTNYNFHEKSISDSCVVAESIKFAEGFPNVLEEAQKTRNTNLIERTLSKFHNEPETQTSSATAPKLIDKNSNECIFSRNQNHNTENFFEKGIIRIEKDCLFQRLPEQPEVQNSLEIKRKLRKKMKLLRGSTNNLITSVETFGDSTTNKESSTRISSFETQPIDEIEQETIRVIDLGKVRKTISANTINCCGFLPEIPIDRINAKNDNSRNVKKFEFRPDGASFSSWQKSATSSNVRLINLDPPRFQRDTIIPSKKTSYVGLLPQIAHPAGNEKRRICDRDSRAAWNNYVRGHPDFNLILTSRTGGCTDYDPFLIAERQMNDLLLSDTCSERSLTDSSSNHHHHRRGSPLSPSLPNYPLSHSSAFVKYTDTIGAAGKKTGKFGDGKRVSLIAPPVEFEDFSSDSTETNSISREIMKIPGDDTSRRFSRDSDCRERNDETRRKSLGREGVLGRRVIIDKSRALGKTEIDNGDKTSMRLLLENSSPSNSGKVRKFFEKRTPKVVRSSSVRTRSLTNRDNDERKINSSGSDPTSDKINGIRNNRNNNYPSLSGSNLSLSSIVSSDIELHKKRSNSIGLDELATSCDDDPSVIYPSLTYLLKNDSLSVTSPARTDQSSRNGQNSDEEFSSPDSYKRHHEHGKLSADSAYSSLNRKYSNHGRNANEPAGRPDEDSPQHNRPEIDNVAANARSKMSKFCHECGSKFPETAKFCCECGIRRLAL